MKEDKELLLQTLKSPSLALRNVQDDNVDYYVVGLKAARENKQVYTITFVELIIN